MTSKNSTLTQSRLKELLHYDHGTGVFTRRQTAGGKKAGSTAGFAQSTGRRQFRVDGKAYTTARLVWLYVHGSFPLAQIDHINGDTNDNRASNLRTTKLPKDGELTKESLKALLHYDPDTGIFTRRVTTSWTSTAGDGAGANHDGYLRVALGSNRYYLHRLAWLYVYGEWPSKDLDHINHIRDDNRICNLREVTSTENQRNQKINSSNTSGHTGVTWDKKRKCWQARISVNGKNLYLGGFTSLEDAAAARKAANEKHGFHPNHGQIASGDNK